MCHLAFYTYTGFILDDDRYVGSEMDARLTVMRDHPAAFGLNAKV